MISMMLVFPNLLHQDSNLACLYEQEREQDSGSVTTRSIVQGFQTTIWGRSQHPKLCRKINTM
jgi:hypothetical protein